MLALRVTYLTGRVYSAEFEDGDLKSQPEWPPHPSRLLSAIVAAWGDSGAEPELRPVLEWLERQGPPEVHAGEITVRKVVQAYVPVNDNSKLPDERPRKGRTFPSGTLTHPDVYFVWNQEPDAGVRSGLQLLLQRTSSLGHSASLVSAELETGVPVIEGLNVWKPAADGKARLRIPYGGRVAELEAQFERFRRDPSKVHRPGRGQSATYGFAEESRAPAPRGCFDRMVILKRDAGPRASLRSTLSLTSALRGALMRLVSQPPPEYVSGHAPGSTPENPLRSERTHVALVPLPFAGGNHATGDLLGLAALLPDSLNSAERQECWDALSRVSKLQTAWGWWDVSLTDAEETRSNLRPGAWERAATVWSTVTPFVFDRYPKDPYGEEAQEIVRTAVERIGLPRPESVDLHYNPWHTGVPKASLFPAMAGKPGKPQRYYCHVRMEFAAAVAGPLVAGAGRFYGYGLFRAHRNEESS
jgi:CRISPR-associated protein Csb2